MTEERVLKELRKRIDEAGTVVAFGKQNDFSNGYVTDILYGRRPASERMLNALGFEKRVTIVKMRKK